MASPPTSLSLTHQNVHMVVLTGGPCAGKTSSLAIIQDHFQSLGWRVFVVSEAASILLGGGINFPELNEKQIFDLQCSIARVMLTLEDTYLGIATNFTDGKPCLILCDRGVMDASVYCSKEIWKGILENLDQTEMSVKDNRYDGVVHMVSTAQGAEQFYDLTNNPARKEGLDYARELDSKTLNAWVGHPRLLVVDNSTDFKEKVMRAVRGICRIVNVEEPSDSITKRKFLVSAVHMDGMECRDSECEYVYILSSDDTQQRIRQRGIGGVHTYTHTTRTHKGPDRRVMERKRTLKHRDYENFFSQRDPSREIVKLLRKSFSYKENYFEVSIFKEPASTKGLVLMEVYHDKQSPLSMPTHAVDIVKEVTGDPKYSLFNLAAAQKAA